MPPNPMEETKSSVLPSLTFFIGPISPNRRLDFPCLAKIDHAPAEMRYHTGENRR
jgi:hypothetical protein